MLDDDMEEFECPSCDLRFSVIWQNDYMRSAQMKAGETIIDYCPACGEYLRED